jgi:hypothetical protein
MKNGDTQITCLHYHISHYLVISNARLDAFLIRIHLRRALELLLMTIYVVVYIHFLEFLYSKIHDFGPNCLNKMHICEI